MKLAIETKDFSFTYPKTKEATLKGINIPIYANKVTALIGPSGCGKSTLLRSCNRIHDVYPGNSYDGEILLYDNNGKKAENILQYKKENDLINLRQRIGMIFQKLDRAEIALKGAALWEEVKDRLNNSAMGLSGGQQQRLCIARAVALKPQVLLFDEPTSALDPISTASIEELISELKNELTVLIVTHNMQQASRISDYTGFMYLGDLVEYDVTETIFLNPKEKKTEDYITGRFG